MVAGPGKFECSLLRESWSSLSPEVHDFLRRAELVKKQLKC